MREKKKMPVNSNCFSFHNLYTSKQLILFLVLKVLVIEILTIKVKWSQFFSVLLLLISSIKIDFFGSEGE